MQKTARRKALRFFSCVSGQISVWAIRVAALCIKNSGKNHTLYRRKNERRDERCCVGIRESGARWWVGVKRVWRRLGDGRREKRERGGLKIWENIFEKGVDKRENVWYAYSINNMITISHLGVCLKNDEIFLSEMW